MSWNVTAPEIVAAARRVCTPRQVEVIERRAQGQSWRLIASAMGVDESAARGLERRAARKIADEMQGQA